MLMKKVIMLWVALLCFSHSEVMGQKESDLEEVVVHYTDATPPRQRRIFSKEEFAKIKMAKEVVKKYFTSSCREQYDLFSKDFKKNLQDAHKVFSGDEYAKAMGVTERITDKEHYKRFDMQDGRYIQIEVLEAWSEEGYEGVMTHIFDLVFEKDAWKISNIMH